MQIDLNFKLLKQNIHTNRRITHVPESIALKLVQCSVEPPWQLCMQAPALHPHKQSSGWGGQWAVSCWFLINWKLLRGQCPGNGFPAQLPSIAQSHPDPRNGSHYWAAHQTPFNQTCERRLTMLYNAHAQATFSNNNITNMHCLYPSANYSLTDA